MGIISEIAKKEIARKLEKSEQEKIESIQETITALHECMVDALYGIENPKNRVRLDMAKLRQERASEMYDRAKFEYAKLK